MRRIGPRLSLLLTASLAVAAVYGEVKFYNQSVLQKILPADENHVQSDEGNMENRPTYLYKILAAEDWEKSHEIIHVPSMDAEFIHFSTEDQLEGILAKYWQGVSDYVVLKVQTEKLLGKLVLEANPGGTKKYYHLYEGSIPVSAVVESKVKKA